MAVLVASTTPLLLTPSHSYHQPRDSSPHHTTFEPFPTHHHHQQQQQQHDDNTIQQQMWYPTQHIYLPCVNEDDEDDDIESNDTPTTSFLPRQPFGINYSNARIFPTIYTSPSTTINNGQIPQSPLIKPFKSKNVEHFTNNDTTLFDENGDFIPYNTYNLSTPSSHFNTGFNNNEQQEQQQQPLASTLTASTLAPTLSMNTTQFNLNASFNATTMTSTINEHKDSFNPTQQQFVPNHPSSFGTSSHINEQCPQFTPVQHQQCDEQPTTTFLTPPTIEQTFSHLPPFQQQQHQPRLFNHIHDNQQQQPQPQVDSIQFNSSSMSFHQQQQQQQFYQNQQQYVPAVNHDINYTNHSPSPTVNPIITPTITVDKYNLYSSSLRGAAPPAVPQPIQHHKGINNDVNHNGINHKLIPKYTIKHPSNEIDLEDDNNNNDYGEVSPRITRSSRHSRQNSKQLDLQEMNNECNNKVIIPTLQTLPLQQPLHIDENEQISITTIAKTTGKYNKKDNNNNNIDKRPTRSNTTTSSIKKRNEASDIDDVWDEKQKYREKNRISAQRSRQKKRDIQYQQQQEYNLCEAENNKLRLKITQLESQLKFFQDFYNAQQQQQQSQQQNLQPQQLQQQQQQHDSQSHQQYQHYQQYH